jgi:hypothetical protein
MGAYSTLPLPPQVEAAAAKVVGLSQSSSTNVMMTIEHDKARPFFLSFLDNLTFSEVVHRCLLKLTDTL